LDGETDCAVGTVIGAQRDGRFAFDFGRAIAANKGSLRPSDYVEFHSGNIEVFEPGFFGGGDAAERQASPGVGVEQFLNCGQYDQAEEICSWPVGAVI